MSETVAVAPSERHTVEYLADMYAAITTIEKLERANHRDLISKVEYTTKLDHLIEKFESIELQLKEASSAHYTDVDAFMSEYDMSNSCAAAKSRLHKLKAAKAQAERETTQNAEATTNKVNPRRVLEAAQHFITIMDSLKLNQTAADQLFPIMTDLVATVKAVYPEFEQLPRLESWLRLLDGMNASDQLSEQQTREMLFDLERGYQAFYSYLGALS